MRHAEKHSASAQKVLMVCFFYIWNATSARKWDFTAQLVWRYNALPQFRILEGTLVWFHVAFKAYWMLVGIILLNMKWFLTV